MHDSKHLIGLPPFSSHMQNSFFVSCGIMQLVTDRVCFCCSSTHLEDADADHSQIDGCHPAQQVGRLLLGCLRPAHPSGMASCRSSARTFGGRPDDY